MTAKATKAENDEPESPKLDPAAQKEAMFAKVKQNMILIAGHIRTRQNYDRTPSKTLSWRVRLLPALGHDDLYKQFHLDEAWDSPHNKTLLGKMPKVYQTGPETDATRIREVPRQGSLGKYPNISRANQYLDGPDDTAVILLAGDAIPWTKPEPSELLDDDVAATFMISSQTPTIAVMASGAVKALPNGVHPLKLRALLTAQGNEHVSQHWFDDDVATQPPPKGYRLGTELSHP